MAHYRKLFPDDPYLGAWDLEGHESIVATIERIELAELTNASNKKEHKPVVFFAGKKKGMVLNKTNCKVIAAMYGPDTDKWIGKSIRIGTERVSAFGQTTDCLRVRQGAPKEAA